MKPESKHDAAELEAGYSGWHRAYELAAMVGTTSLGVWLIVRIGHSPPLSGWWMPLAALLGLLLADFLSGFVHWTFDTWGAVDTPFFGKLAIRTFRHHHADQKAITRHDFIETNGHNFGLGATTCVPALFIVGNNQTTLFNVFCATALAFATFFTSITSQVHKWAHMERPPRVIAFLQRVRLVLSPKHHAVHHGAPYARNYCITVGWMNGPLQAVRFFETLERIISAVTGAIPREDDIGKEAAITVASEITAAADPDPAEEPIPTRD
jgi:ubiquitin-conjugating enzyme E2 variant